MMEAKHNWFNHPNYLEIIMQRHPLNPLRGIVVDDHGIAPESQIQPTEKLGNLCYEPSLFSLNSHVEIE